MQIKIDVTRHRELPQRTRRVCLTRMASGRQRSLAPSNEIRSGAGHSCRSRSTAKTVRPTYKAISSMLLLLPRIRFAEHDGENVCGNRELNSRSPSGLPRS